MKTKTTALLAGGAVLIGAACILCLLLAPAAGYILAAALALYAPGCLCLWRRQEKRRHQLLSREGYRRLVEGELDADALMEQLRGIILARNEAFERSQSQAILDKQAQISNLQSQINPHFLYNTLESIRGQALAEGSEEIAEMAKALGSFFRYNISQKGLMVTLREELANVENYFIIQRYRFDNRFSFKVLADKQDDAMECYIPKLTLQPLVENAIYHGLESRGVGGSVTIEVTTTESRLMLAVRDDGVGMEPPALEALRGRIQGHEAPTGDDGGHSGIALPNVDRRIKLIFGPDYGIEVYSTAGLGTDIELLLPLLRTPPELEAGHAQ